MAVQILRDKSQRCIISKYLIFGHLSWYALNSSGQVRLAKIGQLDAVTQACLCCRISSNSTGIWTFRTRCVHWNISNDDISLATFFLYCVQLRKVLHNLGRSWESSSIYEPQFMCRYVAWTKLLTMWPTLGTEAKKAKAIPCKRCCKCSVSSYSVCAWPRSPLSAFFYCCAVSAKLVLCATTVIVHPHFTDKLCNKSESLFFLYCFSWAMTSFLTAVICWLLLFTFRHTHASAFAFTPRTRHIGARWIHFFHTAYNCALAGSETRPKLTGVRDSRISCIETGDDVEVLLTSSLVYFYLTKRMLLSTANAERLLFFCVCARVCVHVCWIPHVCGIPLKWDSAETRCVWCVFLYLSHSCEQIFFMSVPPMMYREE